jgi:7-cyano-7-deazaguanine synthase
MKLLLFSGGVESTCLASMQRPDLLLTIDYGQAAASGEKRTASHIAEKLSLRHEIVSIPMRALGAGELAGHARVPHSDAAETWPFRNQMLITLAAMRYEREGLREIVIGTVKSDEMHPDGTPEFIEGMASALRSQNVRLTLSAPAIRMSTIELVRASGVSHDLLRWTFSCHRSAVACGQCRGCAKTVELFRNLEIGLGNGSRDARARPSTEQQPEYDRNSDTQ